ncbi:MAG: hypothetical protein IJ588_08060, partial [Prevotella sp.]|nr:hypothetical protein [Prevotella sp.]
MRKNFLILMLLSLLPLAGWASISWDTQFEVKTNLIYTGVNQELIKTAGTVSGETVYYAVTESGAEQPETINESTASSITKKDAGDYLVWVKAGEEVEYYPVTIKRRALFYTASNITKKYGETDASALGDLADQNYILTTGFQNGEDESTANIGEVSVSRIDEGEDVGQYQYELTNEGGNYVLKSSTYYKLNITKNNISAVTINLTGGGTYTYTGSAINPVVASVKIGDFTVPAANYDVSYGNTNTNVSGTHTVTVTAKGNNFNSGSNTKNFTIAAKNISGFTLTLSSSAENYTGNAVAYPTISSLTGIADGVTYNLSSSDYQNYKIYDAESGGSEVTAANLKEKGTYWARVDGKTNYTGTAKAKFLIKGTSLDNAVVTVDG